MNYEKLSEVRHISEWWKPWADEIATRGSKPKLPFTTLPHLSRSIWGLRSKALTIVGARTSQGKSSFALQIANDLATQGIDVLLISLEMDVPSLVERLFCHVYEVDNYSLLSGQARMDKGIANKMLKFREYLSDSSLVITEGIGKSWEEVHHLIESINPKPKVVIVDYIQNISSKGDTREVINEYIRRFRNMAIKNDFAGVLCSQINRGAEQQKDNAPNLAQLKETGFLEESADMVMLLYWKAFYDKGETADTSEYCIHLAKNRNGKTGEHNLFYTPKYYRFTEKNAPSKTYTQGADSQVDKVASLFNAHVIDPETDMPRQVVEGK